MIKTRLQRLIETRIRAGLSQRALAKAAGISSGYMTQIEGGDRGPSPAVAKRICAALGANFDDLFEARITAYDEQAAALDREAGGR